MNNFAFNEILKEYLSHLYLLCISFYKYFFLFLDNITDIDRTMATLDNVLGYYHVAKDLECVIKEGYVVRTFVFIAQVTKIYVTYQWSLEYTISCRRVRSHQKGVSSVW